MQTSLATVCVSGGLVEKLHACAEAGFGGVEIFEPDLIAAPQSPEEIRALADRLGLSLDLYQPFRDAEGVTETAFRDVLRRAEAKFSLMQRLGIKTMLVCSNAATAVIDDDEVSASQLRRLGELAAGYGIRLAYEALAWGRFVSDYRRSWRIVDLADHPNVGLCLDSFHILSRGHDPADIEKIPGERIFFLQLADAPAIHLDVQSWSRHYRLFPGEGSFDLPAFLGHVLRAGYDGPLSLEIFNDVFRRSDPKRTARQALRSLRWLQDAAALHLDGAAVPGLATLPGGAAPDGFSFVEVKARDTSAVEAVLEQLGFDFRGRHRSKQVRLWTQGEARIVCSEQPALGLCPEISAVGFDVDDPETTAARAAALLSPPVSRLTFSGEQRLHGVVAPDGTEIFLGRGPRWVDEFDGGYPPGEPNVTHVDHVNLTQPWENFDEAVLFYSSVLSLQPQPAAEVAGPAGLVRSQVVRSEDGAIRLPLNLFPAAHDSCGPGTSAKGGAQHIALACRDILTIVTQARARGLRPLPVPGNYYDDLGARFDLNPEFVHTLRSLGLLYDRDDTGEYLHFYTETVGGVFFELVERRDAYDGYGAADAPVRLTAQLATYVSPV